MDINKPTIINYIKINDIKLFSAITDYGIDELPQSARALIPENARPGIFDVVYSDNGVSRYISFCYDENGLLFAIRHEEGILFSAFLVQDNPYIIQKVQQYALLYGAASAGIFGMHAVTMEYTPADTPAGDNPADNAVPAGASRVIMLSAPSGTGKTTHSELWKREFDAHIINGDYAFLEPTDDNGLIFHGTEFSGSSPYHDMGDWHVDDIVFVSQSPVNKVRRLTGREAYIHMLENAFVPRWDKEKTEKVLDLIEKTLGQVKVWLLECNMDPEAAHVLRDAIFKEQ